MNYLSPFKLVVVGSLPAEVLVEEDQVYYKYRLAPTLPNHMLWILLLFWQRPLH